MENNICPWAGDIFSALKKNGIFPCFLRTAKKSTVNNIGRFCGVKLEYTDINYFYYLSGFVQAGLLFPLTTNM